MSEQDKALVTDYLKEQNRPWNALSVSLNLHKKVGKTAAERILEELSKDDGPLEELINGKQKVYYYKQAADDGDNAISEEKLAELDDKIKDKKNEKGKLDEECSTIKREVDLLESEPNDDDLSNLITQAQEDNQEKRSKISGLKASAGSITPEEKKKITHNFDKAVSLWRKRKRMANDMIDKILEGGYPKKPKDLMADCGVETDSQCDVDIKEFL
eukprot:m.718754 g.718754  ORF g.718754 m.718754 type:complete len:215 (-) comp22997_c1_seq21:4183-4827(-)